MKEITDLLRDNELTCLRVFYRGSQGRGKFPDIKAIDKGEIAIGFSLLEHRLNPIYLANEIIYFTENLISTFYPEWELATGSEGVIDFFLKNQNLFAKLRHKSFEEELHLLRRDCENFHILLIDEERNPFKEVFRNFPNSNEQLNFVFNPIKGYWERKQLFTEIVPRSEEQVEWEERILKSLDKVIDKVKDSLYQKQDKIFWRSDIESRFDWSLITYALFYYKGSINVTIREKDSIQISWGTPNRKCKSEGEDFYYPEEKFLMNYLVNIETDYPDFKFLKLFIRVTELKTYSTETLICFSEVT